jgi:hypothetical protein
MRTGRRLATRFGALDAVVRLEVTSLVPVAIQLADTLAWDPGRKRPRVPPAEWAVGSRPACQGIELDLDFAEMRRGGTKTVTMALTAGRHHLLIASADPLAGPVGYALRLVRVTNDPPDDENRCEAAASLSGPAGAELDGSFDLDWYVVTRGDSAYVEFTANAGTNVPGLAVLHDLLPDSLPKVLDAAGGGVALLAPGSYLVAVLGTGPAYDYQLNAALASYGPATRLELVGLPPAPPVCKAWDVTLTARDRLGNRSRGYRGTVVFGSTDPAATLPPSYTFTAADSGAHRFPAGIAMQTEGSATVVVSDAAAPTLAAQLLVTVTPPTNEVSASPAAAIVDVGAQTSFTAQVATTCGVPVNDPVTWSSMNPLVATVAGGTATGLQSGQVALRADAGTGHTYAHLTVTAPRAAGTLTWDTIVGTTSGQYLMDVWGSGPNDVWAVGSPGLILRYDGASWTTMRSGAADDTLLAVWGSGPGDVWAAGTGGTLLRFNGSTWTSVTSGITASLRGIWGSGPEDVWVVGDRGTILHFDELGITSVNAGQPANEGQAVAWGTRPTDVWVGGDSGTVRRFDGATWTLEARHLGNPVGQRWYTSGIFGALPTGVYVLVRCVVIARNAACSNVPFDLDFNLLRWGGSEFSQEGPTRGRWLDLFGTSPNEVWVAGHNGVIVGAGSSWTTVLDRGTETSPSPLFANCNPPVVPSEWWWRGLQSLWMTFPGDVWVVGGCYRVATSDWRTFILRGRY